MNGLLVSLTKRSFVTGHLIQSKAMLSERDYHKIINWELKHHKVLWFSFLGIKFYRSLKVKDVRLIPDWFSRFTMTSKQNDEWKNKSLKYLRKKLSYTDEYLKRQFGWVTLNHGLRVDDKASEIQYHDKL